MMGVKDAKNIFEQVQSQEQDQKPLKNSPPKRKVQSVFVPTQQVSEETTDSSVPSSPSKRSMVSTNEGNTNVSTPKVVGKLNAKAMVNIPVNPFKPPVGVKFKSQETSAVSQDDSQIQKEGTPLKSLVKDRPKQMNKRATVHGTVSKRGQESIIYWSKDLLSDTEILVVDLQFSWEDGKALCFLLEKLYPGSIKLSSVSSQSVEDRFSLCVKVLNEKMVDPLDTREIYEEGSVIKSKLITVLSKLKFNNSLVKANNMEDDMDAHKLDVQKDVDMKKDDEDMTESQTVPEQEAKKEKKKAKKGTKKDQPKDQQKVDKVEKVEKVKEVEIKEVKQEPKEEIKEDIKEETKKESKKESKKEKKQVQVTPKDSQQEEQKEKKHEKELSKEEELKEKIQKELEQEDLGYEQLKEKIQKELEKEEEEKEKEKQEEEEQQQKESEKEVQKDVSMASVSSTSNPSSSTTPPPPITWLSELWTCFMSLFGSSSVATAPKAF